jgi:hypothetical protein
VLPSFFSGCKIPSWCCTRSSETYFLVCWQETGRTWRIIHWQTILTTVSPCRKIVMDPFAVRADFLFLLQPLIGVLPANTLSNSRAIGTGSKSTFNMKLVLYNKSYNERYTLLHSTTRCSYPKLIKCIQDNFNQAKIYICAMRWSKRNSKNSRCGMLRKEMRGDKYERRETDAPW